MDAGFLENSGGGFDGGAGGENVVEEEVGGGGVDGVAGVEGVGSSGLGKALSTAGADLNGAVLAEEDFGKFVAAETGEFAGEELGVVKAALADVARDSRERDDDDAVTEVWEGFVEKSG